MDSLRSSLPTSPSSPATIPPTIFLCASCSTPLTSSNSLLFFSPPLDSLIFTHLLQPPTATSPPEPTLPASSAPDAFCPFYAIHCANPACTSLLGRRYVATTPIMADLAGRWCVAINKVSIFRVGQEQDSSSPASDNLLSGKPAFPAMVDQNITRYLHPQPEEVAVWIGKVMQVLVVQQERTEEVAEALGRIEDAQKGQQERIEEVSEAMNRVEGVEKGLNELLELVKEGQHLQGGDTTGNAVMATKTPARNRREVVPDSQETGGSGTVVGSFAEDFHHYDNHHHSPETPALPTPKLQPAAEPPATVPTKKLATRPSDQGRRKSSPIKNSPPKRAESGMTAEKFTARHSVPRKLLPGTQTISLTSADSDSDSDAPRLTARKTPTTSKAKSKAAKGKADERAAEEGVGQEKEANGKAQENRYLRRRRKPLLESDEEEREDEGENNKGQNDDEDKENDEVDDAPETLTRSHKRRRVEIEAGREKEKAKGNSPAAETIARRSTRRSGGGSGFGL